LLIDEYRSGLINKLKGIMMNSMRLIRTVTLTVLIMIFTLTLIIINSPSPLFAEVSKKCADCHTMHNNQDGQPIVGAGAQSFLLNTAGNTSCWGCHAGGTANNIDPVTGAPQIRHTNSTDLAGGNFAYITGDKSGATGNTKTRGHNVIDTGVTDDNFSSGAYPPGDEFSQSVDGLNNATFTCAGKLGCHGDRTAENEDEAIYGSHHAKDSVLKFGSINEASQGSSSGTSYRFLSGVKGGEDSDWEASVSVSDHNEYKGATSGTESTKTSPGGNTISGLCAECHGNFHGDVADTGGSSPWGRHPTDISLPDTSAEYANYTTYNVQVPVARTTIPNVAGNTVDPADTTDDIVMCLSCHRAHASAYPDMLRWNYEDMVAGASGEAAGTGCFVCHSSKDGV
jgi:hypothetical protein